MSYTVAPATPDDIPDIVRLAGLDAAEFLPHLPFDASATTLSADTLIAAASSEIFVCRNADRVAVGFLVALANKYFFNHKVFAVQEIVYVDRPYRGSRAAVLLLTAYVEWAHGIGAREIFVGQANGQDIERTTRFFRRLGFDVVGAHLRRIVP